MRFLKQYGHFESLTPKKEGLNLLDEISDIFNNLEDEYKMNVDYYLTILNQEYEDNDPKLLSKVGTMSSGFDINLSSSSGSSEFSYTWYG